MAYELSLPLKRGSIEIEFEDADDLEAQLRALDVPRIERLVAAALRKPRQGATKRASKAKRPAKAKRAA